MLKDFVRPSDAIFTSQASLPTWLAALRKQLRGGGRQAPPEHLGPVAALDELRQVASAQLHGPGAPNARDRVSLRTDVQDAFEAFGPATSKLLSSSWSELAKDVGRLHELLDSTDGARVLIGGVDAMEQRLSSPDVTRAAWDDVIAAFKEGDYAERCELRLLQLRELCERRGLEWAPLGLDRRLVDIINDDPRAMPAAYTKHLDPQGFNEVAGVHQDTRIGIARDLLGQAAATGEVIVWLAFQNAWFEGWHQRLGPVDFFGEHLWPESLRAGNYRDNPDRVGPPELQDADYEYAFKCLPEANFVLARVQLGEGHLAQASKRARWLIEEVIRLAEPASQWRLMKGAAIYSGGSGWYGGPFQDADLFRDAHIDPPRHEPTSHGLHELDGRLIQAVASEQPLALDAISYAQWWRAVDAIPEPAQRVGLGIRLLERALPKNAEAGDKNWTGATRRYFREQWAERRLLYWLQDATEGLLASHPGRYSNTSEGVGAEYLALQQELRPITGLYFHFYGDVALRRLPLLCDHCPEGSLEWRSLKEVARRSHTGADTAEWLDFLGNRFDRLLARAVRQRNAVLHGTTTVPGVVENVDQFIKQLTAYMVSEQLYAATVVHSAISSLEQLRHDALERLARLRAGEPADQVLFRGCPESGEETPTSSES